MRTYHVVFIRIMSLKHTTMLIFAFILFLLPFKTSENQIDSLTIPYKEYANVKALRKFAAKSLAVGDTPHYIDRKLKFMSNYTKGIWQS